MRPAAETSCACWCVALLIFSERLLWPQQDTRAANVRAVTDAMVLVLSREDFNHHLGNLSDIRHMWRFEALNKACQHPEGTRAACKGMLHMHDGQHDVHHACAMSGQDSAFTHNNFQAASALLLATMLHVSHLTMVCQPVPQ